MTRDEIRNKILFYEAEIKRALDPSVFILQPQVEEYNEEIAKLQEQCEHEFVNGICTICGKAE